MNWITFVSHCLVISQIISLHFVCGSDRWIIVTAASLIRNTSWWHSTQSIEPPPQHPHTINNYCDKNFSKMMRNCVEYKDNKQHFMNGTPSLLYHWQKKEKEKKNLTIRIVNNPFVYSKYIRDIQNTIWQTKTQ